MELTKKNIVEWKKELDVLSQKSPLGYKISNCFSDKEWIDDYLGEDTTEVISYEIYSPITRPVKTL